MAPNPIDAAVLAALSQEVQPFLRRVGARRLQGSYPPAWDFAFKGKTGVVAVSGMGAEAAARAASWIFQRYQPQALISLGFGGAVTPGLPPGALVLGETYWGYEPETGKLGALPAPPFPATPAELLEKLRSRGLPAFQGSIVTSPKVIHKAGQGGPLQCLAHPVLDMETRVLTLSARQRDVPFLGLRAVTDTAEEEIPELLRQAALKGQMPTVGAALAWLAADPRRLPVLLRLWRRSRLAAERLAQALEVVLEFM
jgi:adenosylhomocysteine nucleosidase